MRLRGLQGVTGFGGCRNLCAGADGLDGFSKKVAASMAIDSPVGCNWTASANGSWVSILSPKSGSGTAQLVFSYAANPTAFSRLGGVTVQGQVTGSLSEIVGTTIDQAGSTLQFVPVTPCRVVDTRNANGPFGGPEVGAKGSPRQFNIPQGACNIPSTAAAYSLNVTVVPNAARDL